MKEFYLLQQEGFLARSCICIGLNSLSKGNIGEKGNFYSCFFSLSIGIERIAKLSVILNFLLENNMRFPSEKYLRDLGHDLLSLHSHINNAAMLKFPGLVTPINPVSIEMRILEFLGDFAKKSRYYNLNVLGGSSSSQNPLTAWYQILVDCLKLDATPTDLDKIETMFALGEIMENRSAIISSGMGESSVTLPEQFGQNAVIHNSKHHIQMRVISVIKYFKSALVKFNVECHNVSSLPKSSAPPIPYFYEFFDFLDLPDKDLKRKKRWP